MVIYLQRAVFMGILTIEQVLYVQVSTEISAIYLKSFFFNGDKRSWLFDSEIVNDLFFSFFTLDFNRQ